MNLINNYKNMNWLMITMISVIVFIFTLWFWLTNIKDIQHSIVSTDSIYQDILSWTWTNYSSINCWAWKIFKLNNIVYWTKWNYDNNVNIFIPSVDTLNWITNYDQWYSSKLSTLNDCKYDLFINNVKYQDIKEDGLYFWINNNVLFIWKNTIKNDNSISY